MKKRLAILGATGSIGTQALEVYSQHTDQLELTALSANTSVAKLCALALQYKPKFCIIADESKYPEMHDRLHPEGITCLSGVEAIREIAGHDEVDLVLAAIVGFAGVSSTYNAVSHGKTVALANKESLVVAGDLIMAKAKETGAQIIPVDSEHSAIFQCLQGEQAKHISRIILTASGGPFRETPTEELKKVTKAQALKHPNWDMGAKISVDSATMMNKGLEMIEAKWLFDLEPEQIDIIVHPQSIAHSFVEFEDGSIKAQCGLPDMKVPIQYALLYPNRAANDFPKFSFADYTTWTFEQPRWQDFECLQIAKNALEFGGTDPCVVNAANEVAVAQFLDDNLGFTEIPKLIDYTTSNYNPTYALSIEEYLETDTEARKIALQYNNL